MRAPRLRDQNPSLMKDSPITPRYETIGGDFIIHAYHLAEPFSSFLPGISGVLGKPLWVFYTNRGQGISSFGIGSKDHAMLEFEPANRAYQHTAFSGFRTFLEVSDEEIWEPFSPLSSDPAAQRMIIRPEEVVLEDSHPTLGLEVQTVFFNVPSEDHPLLARVVTISNRKSKDVKVRVTDGLAQVLPYGLNEWLAKHMSRTMEAFMQVLNVSHQVPFYQLKLDPGDSSDVKKISGGFFALGARQGKLLKCLMDPAQVFGPETELVQPLGLKNPSRRALSECKTPSAFFQDELTVKKKDSVSFFTLFGYADHLDEAQAFGTRLTKDPSYAERKRGENTRLIRGITDACSLETGDETLNAYHRQTFLDNVLRGGLPRVTKPGTAVHLYTRKHGDMERDYNRFELSPTFYSQGNGNFRDVNQNRRMEALLEPGIGESNVEQFMNLIQLDGFNPLVIGIERFRIASGALEKALAGLPTKAQGAMRTLCQRPFAPGEAAEALSGLPAEKRIQVVEELLRNAEKESSAQHGEGYWTDHWTYNLDLLENFLAVWPDKLRWVLFEKKDFTFHDSDHSVEPRAKRYVLKEGKPRQLHAVVQDEEKKKLIASRTERPNLARLDSGRGEIHRTTLLAKLLCLIANKAASLDPSGIGIEMESDKPGWCDALNGLPAIFGSSSNETLELKRLTDWLLKHLGDCAQRDEKTDVHEQIRWFFEQVVSILSKRTGNWFATWDALNHAKEQFRQTNRLGLSGSEITRVAVGEILDGLSVLSQALEESCARMKNPSDSMVTTYYSHEAKAVRQNDGVMEVQGFEPTPLSYYLEGPVHAMKLMKSVDEARRLRDAVRKTELYDKTLGMYRLNVPLEKETEEIGRAKIFTPGWLENESIFLHMEYKWLLEELKTGLTPEFFEDLKTALIAYQDPQRYKRSPYENSSFVASSRFPDASRHGQGFVARLTGATSEWLNMIFHMFLGPQPFRVQDSKLVFEPKPVLPGDLFTKTALGGLGQNTLALRCLGGVRLVYENPLRRDTFGPKAVSIQSFTLEGEGGAARLIEGSFLSEAEAMALREGLFKEIRIHLK